MNILKSFFGMPQPKEIQVSEVIKNPKLYKHQRIKSGSEIQMKDMMYLQHLELYIKVEDEGDLHMFRRCFANEPIFKVTKK